MKKILITGKNSYLGNSLYDYFESCYVGQYDVTRISLRGDDWRSLDFSSYDCIYHVAGIAHVDSGSFKGEAERLYNSVNCELAVEVAKKAVSDGTRQFIYLSSILVYGDHKGEQITKDTPAKASDVYGHSKVLAEEELNRLEKGDMKLCILRPPMIYGKGCKGNFSTLIKLADRLPFFPATENKRSMLYVENLNEFVRLVIENCDEGVFFPQNGEYSDTASVIASIAASKGKKLSVARWLHWTVVFAKHFPGKAGRLANKAFGSRWYDLSMSYYDKGNYQINDLKSSIEKTVI